jgi:hypothetical protein
VHWILIHLASYNLSFYSWCILHALAYVNAKATATSMQLHCSLLYTTRLQIHHLVTPLQCIPYCIFYRFFVQLSQPRAT